MLFFFLIVRIAPNMIARKTEGIIHIGYSGIVGEGVGDNVGDDVGETEGDGLGVWVCVGNVVGVDVGFTVGLGVGGIFVDVSSIFNSSYTFVKLLL